MAAHITIKTLDNEIDTIFLQEFCNKNNVKFHNISISIDFDADDKKSPCFVCSWHKRAALFKLINELNCNKLALGHHLDDAIETLFMNMAYNGEISSMPYRVSMFKGRIELIRPMLDTEEKQLIKYANLKNLHSKTIKSCPYEKVTKRQKIKDILSKLQEQNKDVKKNIFRSMSKIIPEYLPIQP